MAATSPYSPNDYQAVSNFRPYELPINDIFKGISAQNMFWDAGAARVKGVYDNALNLKLSLEPNKEIRRKYMEDADKQLTKLSSMDLSDPSVQRQGFALFKPLFQDEGVMFDDLATRHYEKVRNDALTYRNKDNGKGYSDINLQYAMQGYNEFIGSGDRMAGKSAYQNRKEYTPYYDYTEDFSKALKDCKPSSIESQSPYYSGDGKTMTGYMKDSYVKTLSSAQAKGCLEAGLSGNASRQLQIEGSVSYKNHPDVLASDTITYLSGVSSNLSTQLEQLNAKKAALTTRKDIPKDELDAINTQLDQAITSTTDELDKTNHSTQKLISGDLTDLLNNFDTYAGSIYTYKKLYKKALASSFEERRENYKADPVQLSAIRFSQDKYLKQLDFSYDVTLEQMKENHGKEMKLLDLMYGNSKTGGLSADVYRNPLTGEITINPNLMRETANLNDIPEADPKIYEKLTQEVSDLNGQDQTNNLKLYNTMISRAERDKTFRETLLKGFNFGTSDDEWARFKSVTANNSFGISREGGRKGGLQETSWFKAYMEEQPNDEDVNKWANDYMTVQTGLGTLNRKLELGEKQVASELGLDYNKELDKGIANVKPVILEGRSDVRTPKNTTGMQGIQITAQDVQNALQNKPSKLKIGKATPPLGWENFPGEFPGYFINGKEVTGYDLLQVEDLVNRVKNKNSDINKKFSDKRSEIYNKLGFDREPWYFTPNDKAPLVETIKAILPKDDKGKPLEVSIISSDFSGGVKVAVPGSKKNSDDFVKYFRDAGIGTSAEATDDGVITLKGTTYNVINQAINNPILGQAAYQLQTITETTAFQQTQIGAKVPNTDISVPVLVAGKMRRMTIETYKNDTRPEFRVYVEGATSSKPIVVASNPYELFEKISRTPIDLNKPIK